MFMGFTLGGMMFRGYCIFGSASLSLSSSPDEEWLTFSGFGSALFKPTLSMNLKSEKTFYKITKRTCTILI
jgi:hypothetical protein